MPEVLSCIHDKFKTPIPAIIFQVHYMYMYVYYYTCTCVSVIAICTDDRQLFFKYDSICLVTWTAEMVYCIVLSRVFPCILCMRVCDNLLKESLFKVYCIDRRLQVQMHVQVLMLGGMANTAPWIQYS